MDAHAIYQRLPGLTEEEAVTLALAYHLGEADAHSAQTTGAASGGVRTEAMPGAGHAAGRGRMHGLLGALGEDLDARAAARLIAWYAAGWNEAVAGAVRSDGADGTTRG